MSDTFAQFTRCNLMSPVTRIQTGKRATTYHLEDGNVFRLNAGEIEALGRFVTRSGFTIRLSDDMKRRLGE